MKAGCVEDFIGIDVANTCQYPLVQKQTFEPAATSVEPLEERFHAEPQWFRTEQAELPGALRFGRPNGPDESELADIPKAEFPRRPFEVQDEMRMPIERSSGTAEDELPGHLEMDDESHVAGEIQKDHFAAPAQSANPTAYQPFERKKPGISDDRRKNQMDRPNLEVAEMETEAADDRFDFRQLGHCLIILDLLRRFLYDS